MNMTYARRAVAAALFFVVFVAVFAASTLPPREPVDRDMVNRIWLEGTNHSRVMSYLSYISDVLGPRIAGSPAYEKACAWAVRTFGEIGCVNAAVEPAGEFGPGWSSEYISAHMTAPSYLPILAFPKPWTGSTRGKVVGSPVYAFINSRADLEKFRGKLKGTIVFTKPARPTHPSFKPPATRYTDADLKELEATPIPVKPKEFGEPKGDGPTWEETQAFFQAEEVGVLVEPSSETRADYGTVKVDAYDGDGKNVATRGQSPRIIMAAEQYNRVCRIMDLGVPVTLEIEVRNAFYENDLQGYNVVAEIPGTDKHGELVMLGAHLDSWAAGTGAVDNGSGCAVVMEAMRILKALGVRPKRTIRAALWTGEEEGFYGSRGYVVRHFGDSDKGTLAKPDFDETTEKTWRNVLGDANKILAKPEYAKISGYFNYDNGTGRIRGIYIQENFQVRPIFEAWMEPLRDLGVTAIALQNTDGTDHLAFDGIGIPGFQFIQDPLDYFPNLHHTSQDVYDHCVPEDLIQSAVVMASFVYYAAMRDEMLPRKALPIPVE